jgi:hypothetical protein
LKENETNFYALIEEKIKKQHRPVGTEGEEFRYFLDKYYNREEIHFLNQYAYLFDNLIEKFT